MATAQQIRDLIAQTTSGWIPVWSPIVAAWPAVALATARVANGAMVVYGFGRGGEVYG